MNLSSTPLRRGVAASLLIPLVSAPVTVHAAPDDTVLLWGTTTDGPDMISVGANGDSGRMSVERACSLASQFVYLNMSAIAVGQGDSALGNIGLGDLPALPNCGGGGSSGDVWFIYTTCSMIMGNGTLWMRWTVPPYTPEPEMIVLDTSTGEGYFVPLQTRLAQLEDAGVPMGELLDYDLNGPEGTKTVTLRVPDAREYTAESYTFSYSGRISMFAPEGLEFMAEMGRIESEGQAWIVPDAPGTDVIGTFYTNFRDHVVPSSGMSSLFAGMMRQMAGLASRGIPVETTQASSVSMGAVGAFGNVGGGTDSTSTSSIDRIMVVPQSASGSCAPTVIPEDVEMTDLGAMLSGLPGAGGTGPGGTGASAPGAGVPGGPELEQALSQMSEALEQMTPEQQQMLRSFGLGGAQLPASAASQATGGAAAPATAASAMPSAEALYSDDLTQMVQNHLAALGYDTGNTSGELSTETVIAISQFQAEQGIDVTGEVTPQLVGILSAEVDARR